MDWLVKHTNNNGNVGAFGISYPGFYATEAGLCGHPAMKAVSPQAPVTEWFIGDDVHHNGALALLDTYSFCLWFDAPRHGPSKELIGRRSKNFQNDVYTDYLKMGPIANFTKAAGDSIEFWNDIVNHADYDMFWQERDARKGCYNVKPAVLVVGGFVLMRRTATAHGISIVPSRDSHLQRRFIWPWDLGIMAVGAMPI